MFSWLLQAWERSGSAFNALKELQEDNTLAALAQGQLRVSEKKINELLAETTLEGVREVSLQIHDGSFTIAARSERFFFARIALPLKIQQIIFTPYRHRLLLAIAGKVSAHGTNLWQSATAYVLIMMLRHVLNPSAPLEAMADPTVGVTVSGQRLEIDLHRIPEAKLVLRSEYEILGEKIYPLSFVTLDSIQCHQGYFEIQSSVNWDALYARLRQITYE